MCWIKDQQCLIKTAFNWISLTQQHKIQGTRTNQQATWNTLKAMNSTEEWREVTTVHTMRRGGSALWRDDIVRMPPFFMSIYRVNVIPIKSLTWNLALKVVCKTKGSRRKRTRWLWAAPKNCSGLQWLRNQRKNKQKDRNTHNRPTHQSRDSIAEGWNIGDSRVSTERKYWNSIYHTI